MKIAIFALLLGLLLFSSMVGAYLTQADSEIELRKGDNGTLSLPLFSRTFVRVAEGSRIDFNIVDPQSSEILIRNSLTIQKINSNYSQILLSTDGADYEEVVLNLGENYQINYSYKYMPFMIIQEMISHYNEDDRNMVLFFNVPFLKVGEKLTNETNSAYISIDRARGTVDNTEKKDPFVVVLSVIIIVLVVAIAYIFYKKKITKKSKRR